MIYVDLFPAEGQAAVEDDVAQFDGKPFFRIFRSFLFSGVMQLSRSSVKISAEPDMSVEKSQGFVGRY
jgi:hypothetical protein